MKILITQNDIDDSRKRLEKVWAIRSECCPLAIAISRAFKTPCATIAASYHKLSSVDGNMAKWFDVKGAEDFVASFDKGETVEPIEVEIDS